MTQRETPNRKISRLETKRRCQDLVAKIGKPAFGSQDLVARSESQDLVATM